MTSLSFMRNRAPSDATDTPEVDVTPVMNMFIILIPFLVSMAVFTHVSILEFSLPPNVGAGLDASKGKPLLKPTIVVDASFCAVTLGEKLLDSIPNVNGAYNIAALRNSLQRHLPALEIDDEAVVAVHDRVRFEDIVAVMDVCREEGLRKLGLSSSAGGKP